jgi:NAD(P)H-dependent FMN reductase
VATFRLLLVCGSLRRASANSAALRTAAAIAPDGVDCRVYEGLAGLPHFNPDDDAESPPTAAGDLREQIRRSDALLLSTPEYAGDLPGSFKNLLDWTIGDSQAGSIYGKPVAWINTSTRGAVHTHDALRRVLGFAHASIVDAACIETPITPAMVGDDGLIADDGVRKEIARALDALIAFARGTT